MKCTPDQFRKCHALFNDFARHFPGTTPAEWKEMLITLFPAFLAEADGREIPPPARKRESTMFMGIGRMNELIEFCIWLGTEIGVAFPPDE